MIDLLIRIIIPELARRTIIRDWDIMLRATRVLAAGCRFLDLQTSGAFHHLRFVSINIMPGFLGMTNSAPDELATAACFEPHAVRVVFTGFVFCSTRYGGHHGAGH